MRQRTSAVYLQHLPACLCLRRPLFLSRAQSQPLHTHLHLCLLFLLLLPMLLLLCACGGEPAPPDRVQVVLEQGQGFTAEAYVCSVSPGSDAVFQLSLEPGYTLLGAAGREEAVFSGSELTIPHVYYNTVVTLSLEEGTEILCHANGGLRLDGGDPQQPVPVPTAKTHLRLNTPLGTDLFARPGYTLTGWNTSPDGTGIPVGLGSRMDPPAGPDTVLYAQWVPWTPAQEFTWEEEGSGVRITGYSGSGPTLAIPGELGGLPVLTIGENACAGAPFTQLVLPPGLRRVETGAFSNALQLEAVWLYDDIESITDYAFTGCDALQTLHINAIEPPVYSSSYFATFADKFDRLLSLHQQGTPKIVLFSGSSTRFGYDSSLLDQAFPDYDVVNMGVFAYTSATPQLLLILDCMEAGDVLLHSPEFDAAQRQFCTRSDLEDHFYCMMEANYDMVSRLDLRQCSAVFTGLTAYLAGKNGMTPLSYDMSPSQFDEDGNPVPEPSYNQYGDYCLYRPNAQEDQPVYGLGVDYTVRSFPKAQFLDPLNTMYQRFLDKGARVYFTYAPRNRLAVSQDSTPEARQALDQWFRENLVVPVISDLEDSLVSGRYLYGTDNHLSTEGVSLRTQQIIQELRIQMTQDGLLPAAAAAAD